MLILIGATLWVALAQQTPKAPPPPPTMSDEVKLVLISATVRDKQDKSMPALSKDDFVLHVDGQLRAIGNVIPQEDLAGGRGIAKPIYSGPDAVWMLAQETTIRTTVPLVSVPVSVTDAKGEPIEGIPATDFVLLDNGLPRPVKVDVLESGVSPISFVAVVQTSNMSLAAIAKIKKIGSMIPLAVVGANGDAALITYDAKVSVEQDFTSDAGAISEAFSRLKAADATSGHMLDAVDRALDMLAAQPGGHRRNILIIGEAKDRGSKAKLETIVQKLQRTGTTVYSMNYSKLMTPFTMKPEEYEPTGDYLQGMVELVRLAKRNTMNALTQTTGGKRVSFQTKAGLERDLMLLSKDIHSRYLLSFTPAVEQTSIFHKLEIQVKNAPGAIIRARSGYWSTTQ